MENVSANILVWCLDACSASLMSESFPWINSDFLLFDWYVVPSSAKPSSYASLFFRMSSSEIFLAVNDCIKSLENDNTDVISFNKMFSSSLYLFKLRYFSTSFFLVKIGTKGTASVQYNNNAGFLEHKILLLTRTSEMKHSFVYHVVHISRHQLNNTLPDRLILNGTLNSQVSI